MRVIFLDIDGVLVNRASFRLPRVKGNGIEATAARAHPSCVEALNQITSATGAVFVLSSVWRMFGLAFMREWLKTCGIKGELIDATPDLSRGVGGVYVGVERGVEIQAWIGTNKDSVESFVILDDDADMAEMLPFLVQSHFEPGLTEQDAMRAISFLKPDICAECGISFNEFPDMRHTSEECDGPECTCYEIIGGHQMGCYFYGRTVAV